MMDGKEWIAVLVVFVAVLGLSITAAYYDEKAWSEHAAKHHCVVVGKKSASTGMGSGVSGDGKAVVTTVFIPEQTIYQCDDGMVIR